MSSDDVYLNLADVLRSSSSTEAAKSGLRRLGQLYQQLKETGQEDLLTTVRCPLCGAANLRGSAVCGICGKDLSEAVQTPIAPPSEAPAPSAEPALRALVQPALEPPSGKSMMFQLFLEETSADLRAVREDIRQRANRSFNWALGITVLAGVALLVGVSLLFAGVLSAGAVTTAGSLLSAGAIKKLFDAYSEAEGELQKAIADLGKLHHARVGLWMADRIRDSAKRDDVIAGLVERLTQSDVGS